ncbi:MAG: hypothetical protein AAB278_09800, partial [Pseudomonadota bacterium]
QGPHHLCQQGDCPQKEIISLGVITDPVGEYLKRLVTARCRIKSHLPPKRHNPPQFTNLLRQLRVSGLPKAHV